MAQLFWDANNRPPRLVLRGSGVTLGEIDALEPRQWTNSDASFALTLKQHLLSSSFVTVTSEGEADAVILVDEDGAVEKPSLLSMLSPEDILRFCRCSLMPRNWNSLRAMLASSASRTRSVDERRGSPAAPDGIFATFAHIFLSFGNLERAVRRAIAEGRNKEAVDRLFGRKFDSVRRLVGTDF
jgi:hypothetical protein